MKWMLIRSGKAGMKSLILREVAVLVAALAAFNLSAGEEILRLATTTSTYETGLLDYILPPFEKANNLKVHIISVGTGKAIKIAENGDVAGSSSCS